MHVDDHDHGGEGGGVHARIKRFLEWWLPPKLALQILVLELEVVQALLHGNLGDLYTESGQT